MPIGPTTDFSGVEFYYANGDVLEIPGGARSMECYVIGAGASGGKGNATRGGGGGGSGGGSGLIYNLSSGDWGLTLTCNVGSYPNSSYVSGALTEVHVSVKALSGEPATGLGHEGSGGVGGSSSGGDFNYTGDTGADGELDVDGGAGGLPGYSGGVSFGGLFPNGLEQQLGRGGFGTGTPGGGGEPGTDGFIYFVFR